MAYPGHMNYQGKSFSGKAALIQSKKQTRREEVDKFRCSVCEVPIMPDVGILWCRMQHCPRTNKREPTEREKRDLKIGQHRGEYNV